MSETLTATPRHLGYLRTDAACPRCLWWQKRLKSRPPWVPNSMPGIMYACDHIQKKLLRAFIDEDGCLPDELAPYNDVEDRIDFGTWRNFGYLHPAGIFLRGEPDEIGVRKDGTLVVLDNKTAEYKGSDDPWMPQYETQICGYGWIAEQLYDKKVSGTALIYWTIQKEAIAADPKKHYKKGSLHLEFAAKVHAVDFDFAILVPLIGEYRKIILSAVPPQGREKCKDCAALEQLFEVNAELLGKDALLRRRHPFDPFVQEMLFERLGNRLRARHGCVGNEDNHLEMPTFDPDGIWHNWEYLP